MRLFNHHVPKNTKKVLEMLRPRFSMLSTTFTEKLFPNQPASWCEAVIGKLVLDTVDFPLTIFHVALRTIHVASDSRSHNTLLANTHREC